MALRLEYIATAYEHAQWHELTAALRTETEGEDETMTDITSDMSTLIRPPWRWPATMRDVAPSQTGSPTKFK